MQYYMEGIYSITYEYELSVWFYNVYLIKITLFNDSIDLTDYV